MTTSKITDSVYAVNVPEVQNLISEFIYNFYLEDERVVEFNEDQFKNFPIDNIPRYVNLTWDPLPQSNYDLQIGTQSQQEILSKIISEDDSLSPAYLNRDFSEISTISQGTKEFTNYTNLVLGGQQSVAKKAKDLFLKEVDKGGEKNPEFSKALSDLRQAYDAITDAPTDTIGLRVFDSEGNITDDRSFLKTLATSLTLNTKIHSLVIPDFFKNPRSASTAVTDIYRQSLDLFKNQYEAAQKKSVSQKDVFVPAFDSPSGQNTNFRPRVIGYLLTRYKRAGTGLKEDYKLYIPDPNTTNYIDKYVVYGGIYFYSLSVIAEIDLISPTIDDPSQNENLTLTFISRKSTTRIVCFEYKPPPPPVDIGFTFDYVQKTVSVTWDLPVNRQKDIKQIQVFRRKTIEEPFELIAQYGWDKSIPGPPTNERYKTGETVDANNVNNVDPSLRYLIKESIGPIFKHVDKDFVVDTEFFETTSFIYGLACVDAHGLISNYSAQYEVQFDPFRNRLKPIQICDEGSPRPYPNMNLKIDAFKDSIRVSGDATKKLSVHFNPEFFKVQDERGKLFKIVEGQLKNSKNEDKPYYLMQIINLDNQIVRTLKINILDPESLTQISSNT